MKLINKAMLGAAFLSVAMFFVTVSVFAADVTGKWKYSVDTPNGVREGVLNLKAEGESVSGSVESATGKAQVRDGKISGNGITFNVVRNFNGEDVTMRYAGKIQGDEIRFKVEFGERQMEMTAKRVP